MSETEKALTENMRPRSSGSCSVTQIDVACTKTHVKFLSSDSEQDDPVLPTATDISLSYPVIFFGITNSERPT